MRGDLWLLGVENTRLSSAICHQIKIKKDFPLREMAAVDSATSTADIPHPEGSK